MPIIKSAKKRVRLARKATARNVQTKRILKRAVKLFHKSVDEGKKDITTIQRSAQSELDKAGKKKIMHKNRVARKQRQLSRAAKAAGVKVTGPKKTTAKKTTTKKTTTRKTTKKA